MSLPPYELYEVMPSMFYDDDYYIQYYSNEYYKHSVDKMRIKILQDNKKTVKIEIKYSHYVEAFDTGEWAEEEDRIWTQNFYKNLSYVCNYEVLNYMPIIEIGVIDRHCLIFMNDEIYLGKNSSQTWQGQSTVEIIDKFNNTDINILNKEVVADNKNF